MPGVTDLPRTEISTLLAIMRALRDPRDGCPWDTQQTFATIAPYTIEEAYEVADAIAKGDLVALKDELGDLLLQVVYHAQMADEAGAFVFGDVVAAISDKMVRRHPHVFGTEQQRRDTPKPGFWEAAKARERSRDARVLDNIPTALPALTRAQKLQAKAAKVGFDWPDASGALDKVAEETTEIAIARDTGDAERTAEEIGDLLFSVVNLARHYGVNAEQALIGANRKFESRFSRIEDSLRQSDQRPEDVSLDALETLWQEAKAAE